MMLISALTTNITSIYNYVLQEYIDERPGIPVNGLLYENAVIIDCLIYYFGVTQEAYTTVQDEVWNPVSYRVWELRMI